MSRTKRFLFERDPADEPIKAAMRAELDQLRARLTIRIPTRRKSLGVGKRWDPLWPSNLATAIRELGIESVWINDGVFVATRQQADSILERATAIRAGLDARRVPKS